MRFHLHLNMVTFIVASSYVVLGLLGVAVAASLWWAFASVAFTLTLINLISERRKHHRQEKRTATHPTHA